MVVAPLGLEPQPKCRAAGPALVSPTAASAHAGDGAVLTLRRRLLGGIQVGVGAPGQSLVIPIAAPFVSVAVHVVQPPGICRITADIRRPAERWPGLRAIVRLALEIRLLAAEPIAKRSGGHRSRS